MTRPANPSQPAIKGPMSPYVCLGDFLPGPDHRRLLDWVAANRDRFTASQTTLSKAEAAHGAVNPKSRVSLSNWDIGEWRGMLEQNLRDALPRIVEQIGYRGEPPTSLELEFTAYGDGAFYRPHLDIPVGESRVPLGYSANEDRVLSSIYYFHNQPKGFSGGELRLFRMGADGLDPDIAADDFADLPIIDNQLLVFPSWAMHEVRPVAVPSGRFADFRYAVNCWFCRPTG